MEEYLKGWNRNRYGKLAFPDCVNFYGSFSHIIEATATDSDRKSLKYWFDGQVEKLGFNKAVEERNRTLSRGNRIDATFEKMFGALYVGNSHFGFGLKGDLDFRIVGHYANKKPDWTFPALELPVWSHENKVKGYLDCLAYDPAEGFLYIVDHKGTTNPKKVEYLDHARQIATYAEALIEMAMDSEDSDAVRLFGGIKNFSKEVLLPILEKKVRGLLVYFVDGKDEAEEFVLRYDVETKGIRKKPSWKTKDKFLSLDWRFAQMKRKIKKFYDLPIVLLGDDTEGFFRQRWKRVRPNSYYSAEEFDELLSSHQSEFKKSRKIVKW